MYRGLVIFIFLLAACRPTAGSAAQYHPQAFSFEDAVLQYAVKPNESLLEIARRFNLGYNSIAHANPTVDPYVPAPGTLLTLPTAWIVPDTPGFNGGILINLPELRLYLFPPQMNGTVISFPIGIGDLGKDTPIGTFTIIEKKVAPTWYVPESIRLEKPYLPPVVPPGPDNPLGSHALRLSLRTILIHGTDKPWGIGRRSSFGCVRLYPEDIKQLYNMVEKGTSVTIVSQAVKAAVTADGNIFVEVHPYDDRNYLQEAVELLDEQDLLHRIDLTKLYTALREKKGMPIDITEGSEAPADPARHAASKEAMTAAERKKP